jgi:hypothetical protein
VCWQRAGHRVLVWAGMDMAGARGEETERSRGRHVWREARACDCGHLRTWLWYIDGDGDGDGEWAHACCALLVRALCALFVLKLSVKGNSAEAFSSSASLAPRDTMPMKLCACLYLLVALTAARAPGDVLFRAAGVTDAQRAKLTVPSFAAAALLELSQLSRAGVDEQKQVLMAQKLASVFDPQRHTGLDVRVRKSTASQVAGTLWSLSQQQPNSHTAAVKARPNSSPPSAPPPLVGQIMKRRHECVVFLTRSASDSCRLGRLASILGSVGTGGREVWLLQSNSTSAEALAALREYEQTDAPFRLRVWQQPAVPPGAWRLFGGQLINYAKAAFLLWMITAGMDCSHVWQIEDDVFFTGPWHELFDEYAHSRHDLVAARELALADWTWARTCWLPNSTACASLRSDGRLVNVFWPILRISRSLALEVGGLLDNYRHGPHSHQKVHGGVGFHEALLVPACRRASWQCTITGLAANHVGRLASGHTVGVPANKSLQNWSWATQGRNRSNLGGRLFHPVKCEAEETLGARAIRWARVAPRKLNSALG